jgi:hypothetical protein
MPLPSGPRPITQSTSPSAMLPALIAAIAARSLVNTRAGPEWR